MKAFLALSLSLGLSPVVASAAEPLQLFGGEASSLIEALVDAGLTVQTLGTGSYLEAAEIECTYTPRGFIWANCSYIDRVDADLETSLITSNAYSLLNALVDAGVEAVEGGEDSFVALEVKVANVRCSRGGFVGIDQCAIEL